MVKKEKIKYPGSLEAGIKPGTRRFTVLKILTIFLLALLLGSTVYLEKLKNTHDQAAQKVRASYFNLSQNLSRIKITREKRADFFKGRFLLDFPSRFAFQAAGLVKHLAEITPPQVALVQLDIQPAGSSLRFTLAGSINAGNEPEARAQFLPFYTRIETLDNLVRLDHTFNQGSFTRTTKGFTFTITGDMELK
jgi:hypothetical protein